MVLRQNSVLCNLFIHCFLAENPYFLFYLRYKYSVYTGRTMYFSVFFPHQVQNSSMRNFSYYYFIPVEDKIKYYLNVHYSAFVHGTFISNGRTIGMKYIRQMLSTERGKFDRKSLRSVCFRFR